MRLVYDIVDTRELTVTVRQLQFGRNALATYLPNRTVEDIDYRLVQVDRLDRVAPIRAFDSPSPLATRPGASEVRGSLPAMSQTLPMTESERLRLRRIYAPGAVGAAMADNIFNDAATLTSNVANRAELLRGEALSTGRIAIDENGVNQVVDYGVPAANQVAPANTGGWTAADADIVGDLFNWQEAYIASAGGPPGTLLTSTRVRSLMLRNTGIRELAAGVGAAPQVITPGALDQVLQAYGLPNVVTYDRQVEDATGARVRVIAENRIVMLPGAGAERLGDTQFGVTEEAVTLTENRVLAPAEAPGIVAVTMREDDPVMTATKAAAIALPVINSPGSLLFGTVF